MNLLLVCFIGWFGHIQPNRRITASDTVKHVIRKKKHHRKLTIAQQQVDILWKMAHTKSSDFDCVFTGKQDVAQRMKNYPFSRAAKIVAVSYPTSGMSREFHNDSTDTVYKKDLHIFHGRLNYTSLREIVVLNQERINSLTNMLYNTKFKHPPADFGLDDPGGMCFEPRNALLFYDKDGKIFDYLEICFACQSQESLSKEIALGTPCNQKWNLLKQFFVDIGIKYGTINRE